MGKGLERFRKEAQEIIGKQKDEKSRKYFEHTYGKILKHIEEVCDDEYDALLAQGHKNFERLWKFCNDRARSAAVNGVACIDDDDVYGWIDEYVGTDDKEECEKQAATKQSVQAKAKPAPKKKDDDQQELDFSDDGEAESELDDEDDGEEAKPAVPAQKPTPKKKDDAQMDFFDMMQ